MKFEQQQAHNFKTSGLTWLRLQKRCGFMATEVGEFSADVFGCSETKSFEIEVKISMADLKADFRKYKHRYYNDKQWGTQYQRGWHPNYFYFMVPDELVKKAKELVGKHELGNKYGVINGDTMAVEKNPKRLHDKEPTSKIKFQLALRMGSELIRYRRDFVT